MKQDKHPSGLTTAQWRWPFKTEAQRKKVAAWAKKVEREKKFQQEVALV